MNRSRPVSMPTLPRPTGEALAHSVATAAFIAEQIRAQRGWISFAEYMQHALYAPGLGYYSAGAAKFGAAGDFVTAPLISPIFSRTCARRIEDWLNLISGETLLEFGPGTGRFALDALGVLGAPGSPLRRYQLLEVSADLLERQQQLLRATEPAAAPTVALEWSESLPEDFRGVVFANEILDALPAERFVVREGQWWRLGVGLDLGSGKDPRFEWRVRPADGACSDDTIFLVEANRRQQWLTAAGIDLPEGYCGEWQPALEPWLKSLAASLECAVVLIADYGLPRRQLLHPDRVQGSLRCHYRHHALGDPFFYPGLVDLTTWVDFSSVAEAAELAGFAVAGFTTQAAFLLGAGIDRELSAASAALDDAAFEVDSRHVDPRHVDMTRGVRQLLLPGEMGEAVKFMLLARGIAANFFDEEPAFSLQDLRASL